jgi:hypothetical protein
MANCLFKGNDGGMHSSPEKADSRQGRLNDACLTAEAAPVRLKDEPNPSQSGGMDGTRTGPLCGFPYAALVRGPV